MRSKIRSEPSGPSARSVERFGRKQLDRCAATTADPLRDVEPTRLGRRTHELHRSDDLGWMISWPLVESRVGYAWPFHWLRATREGLETLPLGVAIWANLSEAAEAKLEAGEHLAAEDWTSGDRTWLVELISPFATPENKLAQIMPLDLINGPFKGKTFSLHRTDARVSGKRSPWAAKRRFRPCDRQVGLRRYSPNKVAQSRESFQLAR
ncbi:toxin-activating lysine-acyltransferase [Caulobacter sp. BE254]|jgi:hypothetical protein|uniref:toxin-activating lysine-acyltransferase n=1 Tax=Caulobacter sp. BE254 TaxID=2817720 RepID=UPI002862A2A8|nr:toxin-activating lysine-acyltransferase [Caulobacter sp. BE254]MDR7115621.1 hypothetical protein [Caulobacter sp. BE254]